MSTPIQFTKYLVKGRIAETVFAQMFCANGNYTVLEFGYEKVIPQLVGMGHEHDNPVIETLRVAPDFAVIQQDTGHVRLIEVKYRKTIDYNDLFEIAKKMHASWNPSYLFVASSNGFYFDEVTKIIESSGNISKLQEININSQAEYLEILNQYEK